MIIVNRPFFPPLEEYEPYLRKIWQNGWLTNMGPLARELELELEKYLKVPELLLVTNGTVALQMAIKALDLKGEVITTPFSFVASTSSIVWEGCEPVFVDIDPESWNLDPTKIEAAITDKTSAILATHVYGNPCDVKAIDAIAKKHNLKVIYDGAHAFNVELYGKSVFEYGDISICSLHATKWYHMVQGGFIVAEDPRMRRKLEIMKNHGIESFYSFSELGLNGKNSELHASMGLANMKYIDEVHNKRKLLTELYDELLAEANFKTPKWNSDANRTYGYYPILLESEEKLLDLTDHLFQNGIGTRRYFYPSLASGLPFLPVKHLEVVDSVAPRVMCLPLYYDLTEDEVKKICNVILNK